MSRPPFRTRAIHPTLPFPAPIWHRTVTEWEGVLTHALGRPVEVVYGRSRTMPVPIRTPGVMTALPPIQTSLPMSTGATA